MKVNLMDDDSKMLLRSLPIGKCFMFKNEYFMIIEEPEELPKSAEQAACVVLSNYGPGQGSVSYLDYEIKVTPIEFELNEI